MVSSRALLLVHRLRRRIKFSSQAPRSLWWGVTKRTFLLLGLSRCTETRNPCTWYTMHQRIPAIRGPVSLVRSPLALSMYMAAPPAWKHKCSTGKSCTLRVAGMPGKHDTTDLVVSYELRLPIKVGRQLWWFFRVWSGVHVRVFSGHLSAL